MHTRPFSSTQNLQKRQLSANVSSTKLDAHATTGLGPGGHSSPVKPIVNTQPGKHYLSQAQHSHIVSGGVDRLLLMHTVSGIC